MVYCFATHVLLVVVCCSVRDESAVYIIIMVIMDHGMVLVPVLSKKCDNKTTDLKSPN